MANSLILNAAKTIIYLQRKTLKSAQIASLQDFPLKHQPAKALFVILKETISVCGLTVATCRL